MNSKWAVNAWLLLIAFIWGVGFVPQKLGMQYLDPAAFNALRFAFGFVTLLPVIWFTYNPDKGRCQPSTLKLSVLLGGLLFMGALMQQLALLKTSVANVAFITGLYVIIVPMIGFFLGLRYGAIVWLGGVVAIIGLYLMTGGAQSASLQGDLIAMVGALIWAIHLLLLSRKAGDQPQIILSALQFGVCAVLSLAYALYFETRIFPSEAIAYLWPVVNGVIVVGLAYTLQVVVMPKADPFAASLILSLEAVFGAVAGYYVFDESVTAAALTGAAMMLIGCVMAQWPSKSKEV